MLIIMLHAANPSHVLNWGNVSVRRLELTEHWSTLSSSGGISFLGQTHLPDTAELILFYKPLVLPGTHMSRMRRQNGMSANSGAPSLVTSTGKNMARHRDGHDGHDGNTLAVATTTCPTSHDGTACVSTAQKVAGQLAASIQRGVAQGGTILDLAVKKQSRSALGGLRRLVVAGVYHVWR